jgi:hypothetical protein
MVLGFMRTFPNGSETNFERKILDGVKLFTLRKPSKREYKPCMKLQMAYGVRTKNYRQFASAVVAEVNTVSIRLSLHGNMFVSFGAVPVDIESFAIQDGFDNVADFEAYWRETLEAEKVRYMEFNQIVWTDVRPV